MAAVLVSQGAATQTLPPARAANIWKRFDRQPARALTATQERQAGVALSSAQKQQEDEELRQIEKSLLQKSRQARDGGPATLSTPAPLTIEAILQAGVHVT